MTIRRFFTRALTLLALLSTLAGADAVVVTTHGRGASEGEAIKSALAEAIRRVNGATVETESKLSQQVRDVIGEVEASFSSTTAEDIDVQTASRGHIRSYELLSSTPGGAGVEVELRAVVLRFDPQNPRPGERKTVVVERFAISEGALNLPNQTQGEGPLLSFLQDGLTTRLVRSRKFTVLTRKRLGGIFQEQGFLRDQGVAPGERAKLGQLLGADYLVSGRVDYLAIQTDRHTVKLTGYTSESKRAEIRMTLTVFNVASGAIEWEDSYTHDYSWSDAELKMDNSFRDDGALARSMIELAAEELGSRFLKRTFPPRVMLVDTARPLRPVFYLNAGDSLLRLGEELDLVRPGRALVDPDTGVTLGTVEEKLGQLVVVKVTSKLSHAQLVNPSEELLEELNSDDFDPTDLVCLARE